MHICSDEKTIFKIELLNEMNMNDIIIIINDCLSLYISWQHWAFLKMRRFSPN